jgi:hypothetical protein
VTSDGGLILVRELDERLGFGELIEQHLTDLRRGENTQFPFADLLRQPLLAAKATVWSHAGQDRSVALANRVGKPTTLSDFQLRSAAIARKLSVGPEVRSGDSR